MTQKIKRNPQVQILEVHRRKEKLEFKPWTREKDPLLNGKNKRSLRLFHPLNLADYEIREGELWLVQVSRSKVLPKLSADGRIIIRSDGIILKKQRGLAYISHESGELVQKIFSYECDDNELEKYLESSSEPTSV